MPGDSQESLLKRFSREFPRANLSNVYRNTKFIFGFQFFFSKAITQKLITLAFESSPTTRNTRLPCLSNAHTILLILIVCSLSERQADPARIPHSPDAFHWPLYGTHRMHRVCNPIARSLGAVEWCSPSAARVHSGQIRALVRRNSLPYDYSIGLICFWTIEFRF